MDVATILTITRKEMQDAVRSKWLALYAVTFVGLAMAVAFMGLSGVGGYGLAGFGRTAAGLINLILLVAPLMGLTMGALSLASERERGTLLYLFAQPVGTAEVLAGKYLGTALALFVALAFGFGLSGVLIAWRAGTAQTVPYLAVAALAYLLALAALSLGFLLSSVAQRGATAVGMALFAWLAMAFFGDLGLMGTALVLKIDVQQLLALAMANPLQVFKIASVLTVHGSLDVLGPAGVYALRTYSSTALMVALLAVLVVWTALPLAGSYLVTRRRGGV